MSWKDLQPHKTPHIKPTLIQIGDSIWYSTDYHYGAKGMVEYCIKTNKMISKVPYPKNIKPWVHSVCECNNQIYIIDGYNGQIILFNPSTKQFQKQADISRIGDGMCCISINSDIHIFHGIQNHNHLIFCTSTHKVKTRKDETTTQRMVNVAVLKYQNKIIRFGGVNWDTKKCLDTCFMSSPLRKNVNDNIIGTCKQDWKLMIPMCGCGYVIYKHYIITFGGRVSWNPAKAIDSIYALNMRGNNNWIELKHIKCPIPSSFIAILDSQNNVHIFSKWNKMNKNKHYSLSIFSILTEMNENNDINRSVNEQKCCECDILRAEKNSLQTLVDELLTKQSTLEREYEKKIQEMESMESKLNEKDNQMNERTKENMDLKGKINELLGEKNQYLQENIELNAECKENKIELVQMKNELVQMQRMQRMQRIDSEKFGEWNSDELVDWVITIEDGQFGKYEKQLRIAFNKEGVNGSSLEHIDKAELRGWGVESFMDRINMYKHMQNLINQNQNQNKGKQKIINHEGGNYNGTDYI